MTLREDVEKAIYEAEGAQPSSPECPADYALTADAVLSVVRDRLLSDQAVRAVLGNDTMEGGPYMARIRDFTPEQVKAGELRAADEECSRKNREYARDLLAAAWAAIDPAGATPT